MYNNSNYYPTQQTVMSVRANFADIYLRGMRDRSMRGGMELAREIQLADWSTAGEQGKLVFVVSTTLSLAQFISLFTTRKNRPNYTSIQVFHFTISVEKKRKKEIRFDKQIFFFVASIQFVRLALREHLSNRSSGVQTPRDICTRFGRYLYSTGSAVG